jgi:phospholipid/cholesterol/gamma-HCH transport system permease protein
MNFINRQIALTGRNTFIWANHFLCILGLLGRVAFRLPGVVAGREPVSGKLICNAIDTFGTGSLKLILLAFATMGGSAVILSFEQLTSRGSLYLVSFVFIKAIVLEMGPLTAGIVMAIKIGSGVTGRIGSIAPEKRMVIRNGRQQYDINRLLIPAALAAAIVGPALYLLGVMMSILAGCGIHSSGSIEQFILFFTSLMEQITFDDLKFGMIKTFAFGQVVIYISGYLGMITPDDPDAIREMTLMTIVVTSISIMILNVMFAFGYSISGFVQG